MNAIIVYAIIAISLFALVFIARKRFGLLGFALAVGSLLSGIWARDVEVMAGRLGFPTGSLVSAVIGSVIILLPSFVLLFHAHNNKKLIGQVVSAGLYTLLATTFLVDPISHAFTPSGIGLDVYNLVVNNRSLIVGLGLIIATIDLFLTKPAQSSEKKPKH